MLKAADGAGDDPHGGPASDPFNRDLEAFAPAFSGYHHPVDDLSDDFFALCHRGRGGMPEGRHVVRELRTTPPAPPPTGAGVAPPPSAHTPPAGGVTPRPPHPTPLQ